MSVSSTDKYAADVVVLPMVVQFAPVVTLSDDELYALAQNNRDLQIERNARGELVFMPPTGTDTGNRNSEIGFQLRLWSKQDKTGAVFDSSTGFSLPNGAVRSPDAAWVQGDRLSALTPAQLAKFAPLCPDFVVELLSPTDSRRLLVEKMEEYIANGARLGWLIDVREKRVDVYRPGEPVQEIVGAERVSADPELPGFELNLREIW